MLWNSAFSNSICTQFTLIRNHTSPEKRSPNHAFSTTKNTIAQSKTSEGPSLRALLYAGLKVTSFVASCHYLWHMSARNAHGHTH